MSRAEDDEIARILAADAARAAGQREAAAKAAFAAEAKRAAAKAREAARRPRVTLPVEHIDALRTFADGCETLLRRIQSDYLKLSVAHRQQLGETRTALAALVARIEADQQAITPPTRGKGGKAKSKSPRKARGT